MWPETSPQPVETSWLLLLGSAGMGYAIPSFVDLIWQSKFLTNVTHIAAISVALSLIIGNIPSCQKSFSGEIYAIDMIVSGGATGALLAYARRGVSYLNNKYRSYN